MRSFPESPESVFGLYPVGLDRGLGGFLTEGKGGRAFGTGGAFGIY